LTSYPPEMSLRARTRDPSAEPSSRSTRPTPRSSARRTEHGGTAEDSLTARPADSCRVTESASVHSMPLNAGFARHGGREQEVTAAAPGKGAERGLQCTLMGAEDRPENDTEVTLRPGCRLLGRQAIDMLSAAFGLQCSTPHPSRDHLFDRQSMRNSISHVVFVSGFGRWPAAGSPAPCSPGSAPGDQVAALAPRPGLATSAFAALLPRAGTPARIPCTNGDVT
jgi:hypothetical protein